MGNPDGIQEKLDQEKVERFLDLPAYEQLNFWRDYDEDYEIILHEYIMDNEHLPISWSRIAALIYKNNAYADEDIVCHWDESREIV